MMKLFMLLLLSVGIWAAKIDDAEVKIWSRLIFDIRLDKYRIYALDPEIREVIKKIKGADLVDSCKKATLAIESKLYPITEKDCINIPKISNDYRLFLKDNGAVGVFYWLKSRPTILFSKHRLQEFGIGVDDEMKEYVESLP